MWVDSQPSDPDHVQTAHIRHITPGYFSALGVAGVEGRAIDARDRAGEPMVVHRQRTVCAPGPGRAKAPSGRRVRRSSASAQWMTIVGVAADVMDSGLGVEQGPTLYVPYSSRTRRWHA